MYQKALLFNDKNTADKILKSSDPKRHRYLGKELKEFNKAIWHKYCMKFSFDANLAKFSQIETLREVILNTRDKILAEASPYDRVWGIGLSMSNPKIYDPKNWRGRNLAGQSLMQVRQILRK